MTELTGGNGNGMRWQVVVVAFGLAAAVGFAVHVSRGGWSKSPAETVSSAVPAQGTPGTGAVKVPGIVAPKVNVTIRADMTLGEVASQVKLDPVVLAEVLRIPVQGVAKAKLIDLRVLYGISLDDVRAAVMKKAGDCVDTCKVE